MSSKDHQATLIYYLETMAEIWIKTLADVATSRVKGHCVERLLPDTRTLEEHANIVQFSTMDTDSGSCAFVELVSGLSIEEMIETLHYVCKTKLDGSCPYADLIWLANVKVKDQADKTHMRNKCLEINGNSL